MESVKLFDKRLGMAPIFPAKTSFALKTMVFCFFHNLLSANNFSFFTSCLPFNGLLFDLCLGCKSIGFAL
ncbi:hypothetical protein HMPREF9135_0670 [Segatella baroniae F0067]|uniref:Uncharacterized protein n=1 Tax=Segatella baroniae F0067 TaxID=1115809 RepID=U2P5F4_9BACT|nr:hypothetical protein HMPREF9135_0670 [Segatella baroniae F0067]